MKLYSFQNKKCLNEFKQNGFITGSYSKLCDGWNINKSKLKQYDQTIKSYDWIRRKLKLHTDNYTNNYPIWAWTEKPDLRQVRRMWPNCILLELEIPNNRILLSNFDLFHSVLNNWYCTLTEKEYNRIYPEKFNKLKYTQKQKIKSWDRVLDLSLPKNKNQEKWLGTNKVFQACVEKVYFNEVIRIVRFKYD